MKKIVIILVSMFLAVVTTASAQTLVVAQGQDLTLLNPIKTTAQVELNAGRQMVESLLRMGHDNMSVEGQLATDWRRIDEYTVEFDLREGVYFTNGEHFDAAAAKFSLELQSTEPAMSGMMGTVDHVEILDDYTIRVHTVTPDPLLEISFARSSYILPPEYYQEVGEDAFNAHPIGTGPFKFVRRVSGQYVELERNEDYWGKLPGVALVRFRGIQEDGARLAALQTGEVHIATNMPLSMYNRIDGSAGVEAVTVQGSRIYLIILDSRFDTTPVANKLVRQAINYAIDKEAILEVLFEGQGSIVQGQQATPDFFGYNPDIEAYPYDPEKARELLAEAGYPDGFSEVFSYPFGRLAGDKEVAEAVAAMLEEVGISIEHNVLESGEYLNQLVTQELTPIALAGYATAPDAHYQYHINVAGQRYTYYANEEYDRLVLQAMSETNPEVRQQLYFQAAEIAYDDPPFAYLVAPADLYGVSGQIEGFVARPDQWLYLHDIEFK